MAELVPQALEKNALGQGVCRSMGGFGTGHFEFFEFVRVRHSVEWIQSCSSSDIPVVPSDTLTRTEQGCYALQTGTRAKKKEKACYALRTL